MKKQTNAKHSQSNRQLRVGTSTHIVRLVRKIQAAAEVAGFRAKIENMGELTLLRILRGTYTHMIIDMIDVPQWNVDDKPQPLAEPVVKLYLRDISWLSTRFTSALLAEGVTHEYAFADLELDAHIVLALSPDAEVEAEDANLRIAQIVAYRRRTRRRILAQGYPPIGAVRTSRNGYHRNGNGKWQPEAKTAFGKANQRLHRSGVRVYAN